MKKDITMWTGMNCNMHGVTEIGNMSGLRFDATMQNRFGGVSQCGLMGGGPHLDETMQNRLGGASPYGLMLQRIIAQRKRLANAEKRLKARVQKVKDRQRAKMIKARNKREAQVDRQRKIQLKKHIIAAKKKAKREADILKRVVAKRKKQAAKDIERDKKNKARARLLAERVLKQQRLELERQKRAEEKAARLEKQAEEEAKLMQYDLRKADVPPAATTTPNPAVDFKLWRGDSSSLKPHQKDAICSTLTSRQRGHIYFFGMGSGKTRSAIAAAEQYGGALVIVPATLRDNWNSELKKWNARGVYQILSFQQFYNHPVDLTGQFVIVDEAHTLRTSGSKMSRVIFNELRKAHKVVLLTGTPLYNRPTDISVLLNPVRKGVTPRLPTTDEAYESEFGKHPAEFAKLVRDNVIYYKPTSDPDNYPLVKEKIVHLTATPGQAEIYRALEQKNLAELAKLDKLIGEKLEQLSAAQLVNVARLMKKLQAFGMQARQIANRDPRGALAVPKVQKIVEYAKRHPKRRILVFSHFLESGLEPVEHGLRASGISFGVYTGKQSYKVRDQLVKDYNAGRLRILLLSSAGGEGLDLKRTDAVFILEPHWNWSKIRQMMGRAARFQSHPPNSTVYVYKFVTSFPDAKMMGIEKAMVKIADDKQHRIDQQIHHIIEQSNKVVLARRIKCNLPPPPLSH
jgi:SNF2 family DNA or RNA helicase